MLLIAEVHSEVCILDTQNFGPACLNPRDYLHCFGTIMFNYIKIGI